MDYLPWQLEKAQIIADTHAVESRIRLINEDLEQNGLPVILFYGVCHLVNIARYLYRPHFEHYHKLLAPGGFLVYHTFMKGCEKTSIGRPKRPQFLLNPNELAENFNPKTGFEIIVNEVENIHDGRPTSFFVARKL